MLYIHDVFSFLVSMIRFLFVLDNFFEDPSMNRNRGLWGNFAIAKGYHIALKTAIEIPEFCEE